MGRRGGSAGPGSPQPFKATGRRLRCVEPRGAERALMAAQERRLPARLCRRRCGGCAAMS